MASKFSLARRKRSMGGGKAVAGLAGKGFKKGLSVLRKGASAPRRMAKRLRRIF